ncbi:MAG: hypothetical protein JXR96_01605 [Deltaproteobacteria bacterium]|nr:hypothetical protein [Deltaproteobacteria bacterium]
MDPPDPRHGHLPGRPCPIICLVALSLLSSGPAPAGMTVADPRPACKLVFGRPLTAAVYRAGDRDGDRLYLVRDHSLELFRLEGGRLLPEARYEAPRVGSGPMSSDLTSVWARGDTIVVGSDSLIRILGRDPKGELVELAADNHFTAAFTADRVVAAGGQGIAVYPRCRHGQACEPGPSAEHAGDAWDLAASGKTAYALEGGKRIRSFDLEGRPQPLGEFALERGRSLGLSSDLLIAATDSGRLHVLVVRDPANLREIGSIAAPVGIGSRIRPQGERVWIAGRGYCGLYVLDGPDGLRLLAGLEGKGFTDVLPGGREALLLSESGVVPVRLETERCKPPAAARALCPDSNAGLVVKTIEGGDPMHDGIEIFKRALNEGRTRQEALCVAADEIRRHKQVLRVGVASTTLMITYRSGYQEVYLAR